MTIVGKLICISSFVFCVFINVPYVYADEAIPVPTRKPNIEISIDIVGQRDIHLYQDIFRLQARGDINAADRKIEQLSDTTLKGYILQQRYLHPNAYTSRFDELVVWLGDYRDHIGAKDIYTLAERKRPKGNTTILKSPDTRIRIVRRLEPSMRQPLDYKAMQPRSQAQQNKVKALKSSIANLVKQGQYRQAYEYATSHEISKALDTIEIDIVLTRIAAAYLYAGDMSQAYSIASQAARRSGLHVPLAGWVAGLVAWHDSDFSRAVQYFEVVGRSQYASSWTRAAGSYWAARSYKRLNQRREANIWLERAAASKRTFYGLIAQQALGKEFDFTWEKPIFTQADKKRLRGNKRAKRAIAWVNLGELAKAQDELLRIDIRDDPEMLNAIFAYASYAGLPRLSMRLAPYKHDQYAQDSALYPTGPWEPLHGFKLDPALIYAIIRQESRFNPHAQSPSGAYGLMQLMPNTARYVSDFKNPHVDDPEVNLELGQRYLQKLITAPNVDGDLLSLLIAYNAGPGNLSKWQKQWRDIHDPLLFIELLPSTETRAYVERVLSNYWIYRLQAGQDLPSLSAMVEGGPVRYRYASNF